MPQAREISVTWENPNHRSKELFNVPLNTIIKLKLSVQARTSETFLVVVSARKSSCLTLSKTTGKVPFSTTVIIDTSSLQAGQGYKEVLEFRSRGELLYTEPVYVTTQVYDPQQLVAQPYALPLNPGKPYRNPFRTILNAVSTVYHLCLTVVYVWVGLFIILIVLAAIIAALTA